MDKIKNNNIKKNDSLEEKKSLLNKEANQTSFRFSSWKIYLLIPNLIGYIRIILVVIAFYICFKKPYLFFICYSLSQLLDALDGYAARYFKQSTKYGAMLDMVTDRASTAALLIVLSKLYPIYTRVFIGIIVMDIVAHFAYIYSALIYGKASHKLVSQKQHFLLKLYYSYKSVLFLLCFGNEAYLVSLYILHFIPVANFLLTWQILVYYVFFVLFLVKQLINVIQLIQAAQDIVALDQIEYLKQKQTE